MFPGSQKPKIVVWLYAYVVTAAGCGKIGNRGTDAGHADSADGSRGADESDFM